jgi:dihydrofolate reductase
MIVTLIAALSENRVIGRDGDLPWRLPADLRRFKRITSGHTVIMGRKTFETLDAPLPDRRTIVVTRRTDYQPVGVEVAHDLDDALALAGGEDEVFILGGGEIYALALPRADRMELTIVHDEFDGDTFFPAFDEMEWRLVQAERHASDDRHAHAFTFRTYERAD